jgi:hypothetical protein
MASAWSILGPEREISVLIRCLSLFVAKQKKKEKLKREEKGPIGRDRPWLHPRDFSRPNVRADLSYV